MLGGGEEMKMVKRPQELVAAAGLQGVALNDTEAAILLGYLEGHDYCLLTADHKKFWLHDNQDVETDDNDTPYTIRDVIELCQEMNGDILLDADSRDTTQPDYIMDLRKDEMLLEHMMGKASTAIPPEVREYKVVIVEHLRRVVPVNKVRSRKERS